jgi:type IV pilus assembly protein PilM
MTFGKPKRVLGLDLGSTQFRAVELSRDKGEIILTGFSRIEVTPGANRREAVLELLRRGSFRTHRVVAAVSGRSVVVRYVSMPRLSSDELSRSLSFEIDKYLPVTPEEGEIDWQVLGDAAPAGEGGQDQMKVVLVRANRSAVVDLADMLVACGLTPLAIDTDVFALGNAFAFASTFAPPPPEEERGIALVDVGASKTCIHVVASGASQFAREVPLGGNDLTAALARRLGISTDEAEQLKRDPGEREDEVREAVVPVLDDLANEVSLSFDYFEHQSEGSLDAVYLSGGSALAPFLAGSLERSLERRARVWNPLEGLPVRTDAVDMEGLQAAGPSLAVALGLAARGVGGLVERVS